MMLWASPGRGGGGRAQRATGSPINDAKFCSADMGALRHPLAPTFPAGELLLFIPWRAVAAESGAPTSAARLLLETGAGRRFRFRDFRCPSPLFLSKTSLFLEKKQGDASRLQASAPDVFTAGDVGRPRM